MDNSSKVAPKYAFTVESCACGGFLQADYGNCRVIEIVVKHHRLTLRHQVWAVRMGFYA